MSTGRGSVCSGNLSRLTLCLDKTFSGGSWRRTNFRFWRLHLKCKAADCELKLGVHVIHCLKQWHKETIVFRRKSENEHKCLWSWKCWHGIPSASASPDDGLVSQLTMLKGGLQNQLEKHIVATKKKSRTLSNICKTFTEIGRETEKKLSRHFPRILHLFLPSFHSFPSRSLLILIRCACNVKWKEFEGTINGRLF